MTKSQQNSINIVKKLGRRGGDVIPAGPKETDAFGRRLKLESQGVDGDEKLKPEVLELIKKLKDNVDDIETILFGEIMWYDIRSSVWQENPDLSALIAMAYASVLIERSGEKTGHTINVAVDCYPKHFESMSYLVDTIIRTGICDDGGGVVYWGVQNGGAIRNVSQFQNAITEKGGNWIYGTMSHRAEDYFGAKMGMMGKVFCGPDLREDLYGKLTNSEFPELVEIDNADDYVINVGDSTPNNIDITEDLIRARTGTNVSRKEFLKGMNLGMNMCGSPVGKNLLDILRAFGADVEVENEELNENYSTDNIVDPNEHDSEPMKAMAEMAKKTKKTYLAVDPDGDRGTMLALNSKGVPIALTGTEILLLGMENLATYNPDNLPNDIVYDMRTGVSVSLFSKALKEKGYESNIIAAEPGYPFFMEAMGDNKNAVVAVENTCHSFLAPLTNPIWGAKKYYAGIQGGDDAAIYLVYLLALSNLSWDGRNPAEQLEHIREEYDLPETIIAEYKPSVDRKDALRKYDIAKTMGEIAISEIEPCGKYVIDTMNSGARISTIENDATVLVRYSNTGPSFTSSGEAIDSEKGEFMFKFGGALMRKAIEVVKKEKGDFKFDWGNYKKYGDISSEEANDFIINACK